MWEFWRSKNKKERRHSLGSTSPHQQGVETPTHLSRLASTVVNFKDLNIGPDLEDEDDDPGQIEASDDSSFRTDSLAKIPKKAPERNKLVIILVGLPGRGKTFLCNKLKCYLNWLGHNTQHFNVGSYRRLQKHGDEVQSADFFDKNNLAGMEARNKALYAALDDLVNYLRSPEGQVAIFDATNTTEERRNLLIKQFHGKFQYMFIESICNEVQVLEQNYRFKMQYSPDYNGVDIDKMQALNDFKERIRKYEEVYEPITNRNLHYIKLIDMVTGRGYLDVNRISGYLPGKIVFFLMQVCKAGMAQARKIWLTRHGESEFNLAGRIGGDSTLTSRGEEYARNLPDLLIDRLPTSVDDTPVPVSVWTSTLRRTIQTARHLPFPKLRWKALDEIQAGVCDGLTYAEVAERYPDEFDARSQDKLHYRYPSGESYLDVIQRLEPVIIEMERERECICVVSHQAVLRAILGYFTAAPLKDIPDLRIPLHTVLELRPRPDGTMEVELLPLKISELGDDDAGTPSFPNTHWHPTQVPFGATRSGSYPFGSGRQNSGYVLDTSFSSGLPPHGRASPDKLVATVPEDDELVEAATAMSSKDSDWPNASGEVGASGNTGVMAHGADAVPEAQAELAAGAEADAAEAAQEPPRDLDLRGESPGRIRIMKA